MPLNILVGAQWGDEGKGRIVDLLSAEADYVARYNGGDNAGHTVTVGSKTFKLHLIPSGAIHPQAVAVLGNGMVINPVTLIKEMAMLESSGIHLPPERLRLSHAAHLITPAHRALDEAQERARGSSQIGTTGRGIGPAYADKAARRGLRLQDMLDLATFQEKLRAHTIEANRTLQLLYQAAPLDVEPVVSEFSGYARQLAPHIGDISTLLNDAQVQGKNILAEGAQGSLLDLDHGTYPFVTSSSPTAPGALVGLGLGIRSIGRVIGAAKCFQTRVGAGPFPTEVFGQAAERLRGTGANPWDEFGTTTGRPRRVGWLDGVLLRYAVRINGLTELVVTKLDILSGLDTIRIAAAYRCDGSPCNDLPIGPADLAPFEPVYTEFAGWQAGLGQIRTWDALPEETKAYIRGIEAISGIPVSLVSTGPERSQVITVPGS